MVKGLKALHDCDIMHRDLKSANVFLNKDGTGKLGDMNVSKVAEKGLSYTQTGTPYYASPEVWRDEAYDIKSDIWSLGCVLYEMITLKPPFRAENMQGLYKKVLKGVYPKISNQFSTDIQSIVKSLLQVSSKKRPNCTELLANQVVKKKIKELYTEAEDEDETEADTMKNSLLKTIYFPKDSKNILYLTDKLPKPSYDDELELDVEEHKRSYQNESLGRLPGIKSKSPKKAHNFGGGKAKSSLAKVSTIPKETDRDNSTDRRKSPILKSKLDKDRSGKKGPKNQSVSPCKPIISC